MAGGTGSIDKSGCPIVDIEVAGPIATLKKPFTALVDTGFSGFLSLPMLQAFPIGLLLHGTMTVVLADGSRQSKFTCLGKIHFGGQEEVGVVLIEPSSDEPLVGMEFLRKFKLALAVDAESGVVALFPSATFQQALAASASATATNPQIAAPNPKPTAP